LSQPPSRAGHGRQALGLTRRTRPAGACRRPRRHEKRRAQGCPCCPPFKNVKRRLRTLLLLHFVFLGFGLLLFLLHFLLGVGLLLFLLGFSLLLFLLGFGLLLFLLHFVGVRDTGGEHRSDQQCEQFLHFLLP
jgi:hypothetical protein